nr:hypothetical protein [Dawidia soli]
MKFIDSAMHRQHHTGRGIPGRTDQDVVRRGSHAETRDSGVIAARHAVHIETDRFSISHYGYVVPIQVIDGVVAARPDVYSARVAPRTIDQQNASGRTTAGCAKNRSTQNRHRLRPSDRSDVKQIIDNASKAHSTIDLFVIENFRQSSD